MHNIDNKNMRRPSNISNGRFTEVPNASNNVVTAFESNNPDFDEAKDCPQARGATYAMDILASDQSN